MRQGVARADRRRGRRAEAIIDICGAPCYSSQAVMYPRWRGAVMCCIQSGAADKNIAPLAGQRWNLERMTVKIRLKRTGMKKAPSYRVVVADARSPRDGRIIENIGWYNPRVEPSKIEIDEARALSWLKNGAQPTESVNSLLRRAGILERFTQEKAAAKSSAQATSQAE